MAVTPPLLPMIRRQTFGHLDIDIEGFVPDSPSPPLSPSPSTPSDSSCGHGPLPEKLVGVVTVGSTGSVRSVGSEEGHGVVTHHVYRPSPQHVVLAAPRGPRSQTAPSSNAEPKFFAPPTRITAPKSSPSPRSSCAPALPPPSGPLPPVPTPAPKSQPQPQPQPQPKEQPPNIDNVPVPECVVAAASSPDSLRSSPLSPSSPAGAALVRARAGKRQAAVKLQRQKLQITSTAESEATNTNTSGNGDQLEKPDDNVPDSPPSPETALERRKSAPLLTPHSDYRLSPGSSREASPTIPEVPPLPIFQNTATRPEETMFTKPDVFATDVPDSEVLADDSMTDTTAHQGPLGSWNNGGRTWDDSYFMSPLERIGAVQLDANGAASLPGSPAIAQIQATVFADAPRRPSVWDEKKNLAVLLPEAGPTLVTPRSSQYDSDPVDQSGYSPTALHINPEIPSAVSFSHNSFGCHLDEEARFAKMVSPCDDIKPMRQPHSPTVSSPLATAVENSMPTTRTHRIGSAGHPFLVKTPPMTRAQSQSALPATMKSLPATPVSPVNTKEAPSRSNSHSSAHGSESARSQKLRWTKSFVKVRNPQAEERALPFAEVDEIPDLPRSSSIKTASKDKKKKKLIRKTLLDPPEPAEDEIFSTTRVPSKRRLYEAGTCFVRDENGKPVCFGDFFPEWPQVPGESRRNSTRTTSSQRPAGYDGPVPRTLLFFLRNFWCGMCQDYTVASISRLDPVILAKNNIRVVVIGCGDWKMIKPYKKLFNLKFECYTDGPRRLYALMGMIKDAAFIQPMHNRPAYNRPYFQQVFSGVKNGIGHMGGPLADPGYWRQLGGEFVLAPGYKCEFAHRMTNMANHTEAPDVLAAIGIDPAPKNSAVRKSDVEAGYISANMKPRGEWTADADDIQLDARFHRVRDSVTSSAGTSITERLLIDRSHQFISPPPELVPPGSDSSSDTPLSEGPQTEEMDPLEMHRRFYSALALDEPIRIKTPVPSGNVISVDAKHGKTPGRKAVVVPV